MSAGNSYRLQVTAGQLDVLAFEQLVARARTARATEGRRAAATVTMRGQAAPRCCPTVAPGCRSVEQPFEQRRVSVQVRAARRSPPTLGGLSLVNRIFITLWLTEDIVGANSAPDHVWLTGCRSGPYSKVARPSGAQVISHIPGQPWTPVTRKPGRNPRPAFKSATIAATAVRKRYCC